MRTIIRNNYTPELGDYHERIIIDEELGKRWLFDCDGVFIPFSGVDVVNEFGNSTTDAISQKFFTDTVDDINGDVLGEREARINADGVLQAEIDAIKNSPDVVDIVPTYAALQAYDTSSLGDDDIIRVLRDENHDGASTYYRWNDPDAGWNFIGTVGDYYTTAQIDTLLAGKQDTLTPGNNIQITNNTISATDTTYSDFTGTDGTTAGASGLVPAPATTDAGKFLKADGAWDTVQAGPTVVQTTGTSTTDVMSQNAVTSMVFADPSTQEKIRIGANSESSSFYTIAIGKNAKATSVSAVAIGGDGNTSSGASATGRCSVALGNFSKASGEYAIGIGCGSNATAKGQVDIGTTWTPAGYNSSNYRLLTGLYDGQSDHDAVTVGQLNTAIAGAGVKELTSADYNYDPLNTGTNTAIALWLLDPGLYKLAEGSVRIYYNTVINEAPSYPGRTMLILATDDSQFKTIIQEASSPSVDIEVYKTRVSNGARVNFYRLMGTDDVVQATGTSTTSIMSQKAVTDALATAGVNEISSTDWSALWQ